MDERIKNHLKSYKDLMTSTANACDSPVTKLLSDVVGTNNQLKEFQPTFIKFLDLRLEFLKFDAEQRGQKQGKKRFAQRIAASKEKKKKRSKRSKKRFIPGKNPCKRCKHVCKKTSTASASGTSGTTTESTTTGPAKEMPLTLGKIRKKLDEMREKVQAETTQFKTTRGGELPKLFMDYVVWQLKELEHADTKIKGYGKGYAPSQTSSSSQADRSTIATSSTSG